MSFNIEILLMQSLWTYLICIITSICTAMLAAQVSNKIANLWVYICCQPGTRKIHHNSVVFNQKGFLEFVQMIVPHQIFSIRSLSFPKNWKAHWKTSLEFCHSLNTNNYTNTYKIIMITQVKHPHGQLPKAVSCDALCH